MRKSVGTVLLLVALRCPSFCSGEPVSGIYQIVSGQYIECCGLAGSVQQSLPTDNQTFVRLTIEDNLATMTFLARDMRTVFGVYPCPPGGKLNFDFPYGFVSSDQIFFHVDPGPPPYYSYWNYTVSNSVDALRINGVLGMAQTSCADAPTRFSHSNVVAVLLPPATVRASETEVCWTAASNRSYQVQYRSDLTTNSWINLGPIHTGDGTTLCITDKIPVGEPRRFYRVVLAP